MRLFSAIALAVALLAADALVHRPASAQSDDGAALSRRIKELYDSGKYAEAKPLAERFAEAIKARHGEEHPQYARAVGTLAGILRATNRLVEAESLYRRALAIDEKNFGSEHRIVAASLNNLAGLLRALNRMAEAEPLMRRALAIDEKSFGQEHANVSRDLNNLAQLLHDTNRLTEAEQLYRRALAIDEKSFGPEHANVGRALNNLALLLQDTDRSAEAEPLLRRALANFEKTDGPEHPRVATALNNLGRLLQDTKRPAEAEPLYRRALAIDEKSFGREHPSVARDLNNLAELLRETNRLGEAESLVRRALAIDEKSFGSEHPSVVRDLNSLAQVLQAANRLTDAEPLMRRALAVGERAYVPDHPMLGRLHENLGGLYKALGRSGEAQAVLEKALAINEKAFGLDHPRVAYTLTQLGDLYRLEGQCTRAERLFRQARTIGAATIQEVPVLFGTNRKRDANKPSVVFGGERDRALSFGMVIVTVPKGQQAEAAAMRSVERAGVAVTQAQRLATHCTEVVNDKAIIEAAIGRIGAAQRYPDQALVFVHGYNVLHEDALRRAAQIAYDIEFDGGVFLFSWPSRGSWRDYLTDRNTVGSAAFHFREFVDRVVAETKASKVHFVAHSMGNMVLLDALDRIAAAGTRYALGEIISAAPDVDGEVFERLVGSIRAKGGRFTLYASRGDLPLRLSEWFWRYARAGFFKDTPLIVPGVDTIDITAAGTSWFAWNHDLYASNPVLVVDMRRIIERSERPPDRRSKELFERVESKAGTYWRLRQP